MPMPRLCPHLGGHRRYDGGAVQTHTHKERIWTLLSLWFSASDADDTSASGAIIKGLHILRRKANQTSRFVGSPLKGNSKDSDIKNECSSID